jgi:MFS family permease
MRKFAAIWITSSFALGVTLPVINMMILEKGASLSSLALFMGLYSAVIVGTEVPSGMVADRFGRKTAFLLSKLFTVVGSLLLVAGSSEVLLVCAVVFLGLARSFVSGSFEALTVDWHIGENGIDSLHKITTRISVWETIGLSLGSLSAGLIAVGFERMGFAGNRYNGNFIVSGLLQLFVVAMTLMWIVEPNTRRSTEKFRKPKMGMLAHLKGNRTLLSLLLLAFALGFLLSAIEKYWQPRLVAVTGTEDVASILLGIVAFIGFAGALGGTILAGFLLDRHPNSTRTLLIAFRVVMALGLVALTMSASPTIFIVWYGGFYLLLGMGSVAEQTLLNKTIPSEIRASLLSVSSFFLQIGGLVSSLFAALWMNTPSGGIDSLWMIASAVLVLSTIGLLRIRRKQPE